MKYKPLLDWNNTEDLSSRYANKQRKMCAKTSANFSKFRGTKLSFKHAKK
jgi:hypothetical protein